MSRFEGYCEQVFSGVDIEPMKAWIDSIPFLEWPQQHALYGEARPAMINDRAWHGFGEIASNFIGENHFDFLRNRRWYNPMISAIMPGHFIPSHSDEQGLNWLFRIHVPLSTNPSCCFFMDKAYHMKPGFVYKVNVKRKHAIINHGNTPRIHFMFDVDLIPDFQEKNKVA